MTCWARLRPGSALAPLPGQRAPALDRAARLTRLDGLHVPHGRPLPVDGDGARLVAHESGHPLPELLRLRRLLLAGRLGAGCEPHVEDRRVVRGRVADPGLHHVGEVGVGRHAAQRQAVRVACHAGDVLGAAHPGVDLTLDPAGRVPALGGVPARPEAHGPAVKAVARHGGAAQQTHRDPGPLAVERQPARHEHRLAAVLALLVQRLHQDRRQVVGQAERGHGLAPGLGQPVERVGHLLREALRVLGRLVERPQPLVQAIAQHPRGEVPHEGLPHAIADGERQVVVVVAEREVVLTHRAGGDAVVGARVQVQRRAERCAQGRERRLDALLEPDAGPGRGPVAWGSVAYHVSRLTARLPFVCSLPAPLSIMTHQAQLNECSPHDRRAG